MIELIKSISLKRISLHLVYWSGIVLLYTYIFGRSTSNYSASFNHMMTTLPIYIGATYFTNYYILPKYLLKKNYVGAIVPTIYLILSTAFFYVVITIMFTFSIESKTSAFTPKLEKSYFDLFTKLSGVYIVVFSAAAIKLLKVSFEIQNKNKYLIQQKLQAELNLLKAQIHPHFLFNTLNNLYSLALNKSEKTPDIILKLSELLDYFLYKSNSENVELKDELNMIQNYSELEKLRLNENFDLKFEHKILNEKTKIAPLIIIPFIENAFKHCGLNGENKKYIHTEINLKMNKFKLLIINSVGLNKVQTNISGGIGLENVKKRLELIYPENYELDIIQTQNEFRVNLEINLSENDGN